MSCLPPNYTLEWNANPLQPIRYRINTTKDIAEIHNFLWTEAITKYTGIQYFSNEKSIRFTIPFQTTNISISLFPSTGTIMLQGNSSPHWANLYMPNICNYVTKDEKGYLKSSTCIVCGGESNNEMVVCDRETCMYWTHNECAGLTEEAARSSSYWCKACVDKYVENQEENQNQSPLNLTSSTPNKSIIQTDVVSLISSKNDSSIILDKSTPLSNSQLSISPTISEFLNS